jgi:hypothetical protein
MALFKKKPDPISDRARMLTEEIAALEAKIKKLDSQLHVNQSHPRLRSTAIPHGTTVSHVSGSTGPTLTANAPVVHEPIFEEINQNRLKAGDDNGGPDHSDELGMRKNGLWQRIRHQMSGPSTTNPKLVSYLAAGGIQGLRPLRYEKRVARNRFIMLVVFLLAVLLGILFVWHPWRS